MSKAQSSPPAPSTSRPASAPRGWLRTGASRYGLAALLLWGIAACGVEGSDPSAPQTGALTSLSTEAASDDIDSACSGVRDSVPLGRKPVDIILVVDNSGSMTDEIVAIQNNINSGFADILSRSGLDYRVIAVARHGSASAAQSICISRPPPLSTACSSTSSFLPKIRFRVRRPNTIAATTFQHVLGPKMPWRSALLRTMTDGR